jgi:hypothetical protein
MKLEGDQFSFKKVLFSFFLIIPFFKKNIYYLIVGSLIGLSIGLYFDFQNNKSKEQEVYYDLIFLSISAIHNSASHINYFKDSEFSSSSLQKIFVKSL